MKTPSAILLLILALFRLSGVTALAETHIVTNTNDAGSGSLRQAIILANQLGEGFNAPTQTIVFNITPSGPVYTIRPLTALPIVDDVSVVIDGATQPGYAGIPRIELSGENLTGEESGLWVRDGQMTVRALTVNRFPGYGIAAGAFGNIVVTGCYIGTNSAGTAAAGNGKSGVLVSSYSISAESYIGLSGQNPRNIISGNGENGIHIEIFAEEPGDDFYGVRGYVSVRNNSIGTNAAGSAAIPNQGHGILAYRGYDGGASDIVIGASNGGNLISGNLRDGINCTEGSPFYYFIQNNIIGLSGTGAMLGNGDDGIEAYMSWAEIGGATTAEGNVISGNAAQGVDLHGYDDEDYTDSQLRQNLIGTNPAGNAARPNGVGGVYVKGDIVIGASGQGNVISGNTGDGITFTAWSAEYPATSSLVGNLVGITRGGAVLGNSGNGVRITDTKLTAGGTANLGEGNVIGGNGSHGIFATGIYHVAAYGNWIGVTATGADAGNGGDGVRLFPFVGHNYHKRVFLIGGTEPAMSNRIAFNNGAGVALPEISGIGAHSIILGNAIYSNGGLGIDLGPTGITANDPGDADAGANDRQNAPVLTAASPTKVAGTITGAAGTVFRIECFRTEPDATGVGEGRYYLGGKEVTTGSNGVANFLFTGLSLTAGQSVTATATPRGNFSEVVYDGVTYYHQNDVLLNTSEFCLNRTVGAEIGDLSLSATAYSAFEHSGSVQASVIRTGSATTATTVQWTASGGTATAGADYPQSSGTITFSAGQTSRPLIIPLTDDNTDEPAETFTITLSEPTSGAAVISPATATATINDNDLPAAASISPASVTEGNSGITTMTFNVTLSAPSEFYAFVNCTAVAGTAAAPADYASNSETLGFPPGETQASFTVDIAGDQQIEADETFSVVLSSPNNAMLGTASATGTIINDDHAGTLQFASAAYSVGESEESKTLVVTRSGGIAGAVSVNYLRTGGTATGGADFLTFGTSGLLTFAQGETTKYISINLLEDSDIEGSETLNFQLSNPTGGATVGTPATTTLTIADDETAPLITGRVLKEDGSPLPGATITLGGNGSGNVTSDANGNYQFSLPVAGAGYTVNVSYPNWSFDPAQRSYASVSTSQSEQNFTGTPLPPPDLFMDRRANGSFLLYWSSQYTGWTLMGSSNMAVGSWQPVPIPPSTRGEWHTVIVPGTDPRGFFKLVPPGAAGEM